MTYSIQSGDYKPTFFKSPETKNANLKPIPLNFEDFSPKLDQVKNPAKRKFTISPGQNSEKLTKSRKIIDAKQNLAPTVDHSTDLKSEIKEHAHLRIQLFFLTAVAFYKRACRTDGTITNVKVMVTHATLQVGQGNKENHAAHANASASTVDNLKENYILQINMEALTPKKSEVLKAKGLIEKDLNAINQNHTDYKFVKNLINTYWPSNSLLKETELELTLNTTNHLPARLNLGCDLPLEKHIRPYIGEQLARVMKGEVDPKEATNHYILEVQNHFKNRIISFQEKIDNCSDPERLNILKKQLFYHQMELEGSVKIDYDHLQKGFICEENPEKIDPTATLLLLKPKK